jgi:hypothetical protein
MLTLTQTTQLMTANTNKKIDTTNLITRLSFVQAHIIEKIERLAKHSHVLIDAYYHQQVIVKANAGGMSTFLRVSFQAEPPCGRLNPGLL